jgi:hypothetical protein
VIEQDPPHGLGGSDVEVGSAGPRDLAFADELEVGLVDEGRCLQGVIRPLGGQRPLGHGAELVINQRQQALDALGGVLRLVEQNRQRR